MKKLFLFVAVAALTISLNSCSSSGSSSSGSISFKLNGVKKTVKHVTAFAFGGTTYISAYNGSVDSPTDTIDLQLDSNETGANVVTAFYYDTPDSSYYNDSDDGTLISNVSKNTASSVKGTFSGTLYLSGGDDAVITSGSFSSSLTTEN